MPTWNPSNTEERSIIKAQFLLPIYSLKFHARKLSVIF